MGFGILFCGYLITYLLSLNPYAALTRLAGYLVLAVALGKLARHNRWFGYSRLTIFPLLALSLINAGIDVAARVLGEAAPAILATVSAPLENCITLFVLLFHVCLQLGIFTIATETGLAKLAVGARLNVGLTAAYGALSLISMLPVNLGTSYAGTLGFLLFCVGLIWTVCNLVLIFRCYMWICLEGDEEMEQKPSRFAFVNAYREKQAARNRKAYDEAMAYAAEKRARRVAALGRSATKPKYHKKKKK